MVKKIAITGTHGAGKTTLCFMMAGYYKKLGYNVNVVQEVARKCPFPINENMSEEAVLWIYHEHVKTELEVSRNHDIVISDRTFYDSFIYGRYFDIKSQNLFMLDNCVYNQLLSYNKIFLVTPDIPVKGDGTRMVDKKMQMDVHENFLSAFKDVDYTSILSTEIFDMRETWQSYCTLQQR